MDPASEALPDDLAALKAALIAERARRREVATEPAVAQAKASEDMALIAAQKLRIAKLERQVFGQRSERFSAADRATGSRVRGTGMFVLLGGLKWSPLASGVWSLIVAMAVAVFAYGMPLGVTVQRSACCPSFSSSSTRSGFRT